MPSDYIVVWIILFIILWAVIEQKLLVITTYKVSSKRLPQELNGTSFVVLADLHNNTFGKNNERLIRKIEKLAPDFILIAGDMVNKRELSYPSHAFQLLNKLSKNYRIYYAYGNHEQKIERLPQLHVTDTQNTSWKQYHSTWVEFKERLSKAGVIFLNNESATVKLHDSSKKLDATLRITGVSIGPEYFSRNTEPGMPIDYLESLVGKSKSEEYQILIAHNPVHFTEYAAWGAELTISGHLHGGMVRLPGIGGVISPQAKFFPKYHSGNFTELGQEMIVSRGLGSHSVMPRLFNIPEIVQVTLKQKA